jgi:outer membrane protein assembly factor BamB/HEAT repeat protein
MVGVVADYLKARRHRRGRHVLFVGSGARIPPEEVPLGAYLQNLAAAEVGDSFARLPAEARPPAQLEAFAQAVPEPAERCRRLRGLLAAARPAEGHVRLATLIKDGYFPAIFTMEPHSLLEQALHNNFMEPGVDYNLVALGADPPEAVNAALQHSARVTVVKCGGDLENQLLPLTEPELTALLAPYEAIIAEAFSVLVTFVAYAERDRPLLRLIPRTGGKLFWINPTIPLSDRSAFDELRADEPGVAEYHKLQPEVTSLLESRQSQRHILAREAGSFNEFFSALSTQLKAHARRSTRGRRELSVLRGGPYRFLDYFDVEDGDFFFGREEDTERLLNLVSLHHLAVLFGRSAVGKTSLLRAGLMARLRELDEEYPGEGPRPLLPVYATCSDDPGQRLKRALLARAESEGIPLPPETAESSCHEVAVALAEAAGRDLLLIVDHFAEIFVKVGALVREQFIKSVQECLDDERLHFLFCLREDYLGEFFELRDSLPGVMENMYRLRRLTREQAEGAITKPATNFNLQIERDLVDRLLEDLSREGVEPAELQIVMYRLYEEMEPPSRVIGQRLYEQLGGAQKILAGYLDKALSQLPTPERPVAQDILRAMVASSELRGRWTLERILHEVDDPREAVEKVLAHLVDHRLLRVVDEEGRRSYELAHEYLAEGLRSQLGGGVRSRRDIQDLLTRELNNYEKFGLLMDEERLRIITDHAEELRISPDELELVLRSAAANGVRPDYWFGRVSELGQRRDAVLISLLSDPSAQVRLAAYQGLPHDLSAGCMRALAAGLSDEVPEIRALAAKALSGMERQLVAFLQSGDSKRRNLAATAIGALRLRRQGRRLLDALTDEDPHFTEVVVEALRNLEDPRLLAQLRHRVESGTRGPWAAATVLGRLSHTDQEVEQLRRRAAQQPGNARLLYAWAVAEKDSHNYPQAARLLEQALERADDPHGRDLIGGLLAEVQEFTERAEAEGARWVTFGGSPRHEARAALDLRPPLEEVWATRTGGPVVASPVVGRSLVYIGSRDGTFYALDSARGDIRWTVTTGGRIEGTAALSEQAVFFGATDRVLYAIEPARGQALWRRELTGPIRAACTLTEQHVLVGDMAGHLHALSRATGRPAWGFATEGEIFSAPALAGDLVIFGSWDAHLYALEAETGREVWRVATGGPVAASPTVGEDLVWCGSDDGYLYAVSRQTGEIEWSASLRGRIRSTPALWDGRLIVGSGDGGIYCLDAATGAVHWRVETGDEVLASAALAGDLAYVGSKDGSLYALSVGDGEVLWKDSTSYGIYSSPALADEAMFTGWAYYYVAAFRSAR